MKVIYDTEQPTQLRVVAIDNDGNTHHIACFDIKIETVVDGELHEVAQFTRWGKLKERKGIARGIQALLDGKTAEGV